MPRAESAAGDGAVFTAHLPRREAVKVAKKMRIFMLAEAFPLLLGLDFEFDSFLYFQEVGRVCAVT